MTIKFLIGFGLMMMVLITFGQRIPKIDPANKFLIKEAIKISDDIGPKLWNGIDKVTFTILLVTDTAEFLINHPKPSSDFISIGYDSLLESELFYRSTQYNKHFLATFPAVNGFNCVVVGTPENTGKKSIEWITTLLHENFHQFQYNDPDYYTSAENLGLSDGDNSGMWMLNYPFPYDDDNINEQFDKYVSSLTKAISSIGDITFNQTLENYITERKNFKHLLDSNDYKYFSFQIWQEGIARYTEYKYLQQLKNYQLSNAVKAQSDYISFGEYENEFFRSQIESLTTLSLKECKRSCFYAVGFAEGLILDTLNADWHEDYLADKFFIEYYSKKFVE